MTRGTSAEIEITLRGDSISGTSTVPRPIPIEPFAVNKDMGRILLRRGGETIAAGRFIVDLSRSLWDMLKHDRNHLGNSSMKFVTEKMNSMPRDMYTIYVFAPEVPKS